MPRTSVKSPDAFRTISEAADALDLPQHVLRFWETRFSQIKPMKRSGGRRYYRPTDIALLHGIRHLLYDEGYTIKGVQRILREQGIAHVAGLGAGQVAQKPVDQPISAAISPPTPPPAPRPEPVTASTPIQAEPAQASAIHPPTPNSDAVHQALSRPPSIVAEPPLVAAQPALQPAPTPPADPVQVHPANGQPQPTVHQPTLHQPPVQQAISEPAVSQQQAEPSIHQPKTFSPLGSAPSSTLRFVPDVETMSEPAAAAPLPLQPQPAPPQPTPIAPNHVAATADAPSKTGHPELRLSPQNTETLVQALRTLLDCKAILDSARQPSTKPSSTKLEGR